MFKSIMSCHLNNFDSQELAIFGLIQIWECALNWFIMEPVHEPKLDICHVHDLGATYPKHVFSSIPYVQMILNWFENLHGTQTRHILNI